MKIKKMKKCFSEKKTKNSDNYNEKKVMGEDKNSKRHSHHHHHHKHKYDHNRSKSKKKKIKELEINKKNKEYSDD